MNYLDILDQIEEAKGKEKISILERNKDNKQLAELLELTFSYTIKFYIKKFDIPTSFNNHSVGDFMFTAFIALLNDLSSQAYRGNKAIETTQNFLKECTEQEVKWFTRVIKRDLKCGIDIKSINKAGFDIPLFEVMLAKDGKECNKLTEMANKGMFISYKLDGYRCLAIIKDGDVSLYSRNGNLYENFPSIEESLSKALPTGSYILDGEIMSNDFNSMQQTAFASVRGTAVGDVVYNVFDYVPYEEWIDEEFKLKAEERFKNLDILFENELKNINNIKKVEHTFIKGENNILEKEKQYIELGYEGAMALPNIPYFKGKKSNRMLKFKTMKSMDCKVLSVYEGRDDSKYTGTCGGLTVLQENGLECDVGSGLTDHERDYIWNNKDAVIGRTVEVKFQELTPDGIMRFPIKKTWRNDK